MFTKCHNFTFYGTKCSSPALKIKAVVFCVFIRVMFDKLLVFWLLVHRFNVLEFDTFLSSWLRPKRR